MYCEEWRSGTRVAMFMLIPAQAFLLRTFPFTLSSFVLPCSPPTLDEIETKNLAVCIPRTRYFCLIYSLCFMYVLENQANLIGFCSPPPHFLFASCQQKLFNTSSYYWVSYLLRLRFKPRNLSLIKLVAYGNNAPYFTPDLKFARKEEIIFQSISDNSISLKVKNMTYICIIFPHSPFLEVVGHLFFGFVDLMIFLMKLFHRLMKMLCF